MNGIIMYNIRNTYKIYVLSVVSIFKHSAGHGHVIKQFDSAIAMSAWIRSNQNSEWYSMSTTAIDIPVATNTLGRWAVL